MAMHKHMSFLVLVYAILGVLSSLEFGRGSIVGGLWNKSCTKSEKEALLLLKKGLFDYSSHLSSWVGDDCCSWQGIGCDNITRHVTQLDLGNGHFQVRQILPSLLNLKNLNYLDLSSNSFDGIQIPEFFGSFKDLTYLNLSGTSFRGIVPHHLGNLSNLRYLDLGFNYYLLNIDSMGWLSKLPLLEHLDLTYVNLSRASDWFPAINMLPNTILLKLQGCQLPNNIPCHLPFMNFTSLVSLDLSNNKLNSSFPVWVVNNTGLAYLNLEANHFNGPIPDSIETLTSLREIYLSDNNLNGSIPESIRRLTFLTNLDLRSNNFGGLIPESIGALTSLANLDLTNNKLQGLIPQSIGALTSLANLDLSNNKLQGLIPQSIGNLSSLSNLFLSYNKLSGSIPPELGNITELTNLDISSNELSGFLPKAFCQLSKLEVLFIHDNQLSGSIPECIGQLSHLEFFRLYSNSWEGFLSEHHFVNLTSLIYLYISSKSNLVLNISSEWVPPFQLQGIYMESLKVGPKFPQWLLTQKYIMMVRIPNTGICNIPINWFVLLSKAMVVDLSNNDINGEHLSSILSTPSDLITLALSNSHLSGGFPAFLCNLTFLRTLVISNNNFSGELPQCLGNLIDLQYLDVMNNSFSGEIPVSLGSLRHLTYLNLHNNNFQGKVPMSFQNLKELVALDVGKNDLSDILPTWTAEQLPHLKYIILRSNNFFGNIPTQLCNYSSIQILNLAKNQIRGNIPPCFGNLKAMIASDNNDLGSDFFFEDGEMIIDDAKGYELRYTHTLAFMFSIDLSNNNISGEIPKELMNLGNLLNLNLAGNHLAGRIPDEIGKLKNLESLDLSRNALYGQIPQSLSNLNFLSHLNLSFNNISGRIPAGNQLQTLDDPSIYAGNDQLCGQPILKTCAGGAESPNVHDYNEANSDSVGEFMWFYAGIGPGLLVGFLGFCASLHFIKSWRYYYFHLIDQVFNKIAVAFALLRRKFHN